MMAYVLTWGNAYAEIVSSGIEDVAELWPIPPNRMLDIRYKNGALSYEIQLDGGSKWFPRSKILHLAGLGFDGFQGYSPVAMARKSIGLGMAMETFGAEFFGQGTHPGVVVSHPGRLGPEAHTNLRKDLTDKYSGLGQAHRLMLLEEGMKIEKIGIPPEDSQFLQSRQFQVPEIARWFNLPPHKLKDLSKSSFNNIESEQISFVTDSILPWLVRLEQAYNAQLLTDAQRYNRKLYFKHVVEGLLRGDASSRADFYTKMFQIGAMSINEIREKEDLNPVDGGDVHFVPLNMTTLENAGKEPVEPETPQIEPDEAENEAVEAKKRRVVGNEDTEAEPVQAPGVVRIAYRKQDA
jgi:HK97 family phage portal protein